MGICNNCPANCIECSADVNVCSECATGYTIINNECTQCLLGIAMCDTSLQLTSCGDGYFQNSNTCSLCPTGCSRCTSSSACTSCSFGFTLKNNQCVENCAYPCSECNDGSPSQCTACLDNQIPSGTTCNFNADCNTFGTCTACPRGTYLENSKCPQCTTTDSNCVACENPADRSICTHCAPKHYLSNSNQCVVCKVGCSLCLTEHYCMGC